MSFVSEGSFSLNADQRRAGPFQKAILIYTQKVGRTPRSLGELRSVGESDTYVKLVKEMEVDGHENDFLQTFRFIASGSTIKIRGNSERVIAMGTRSMLANRVGPDVPYYRILVVQTENGDIGIRQYPEESLDFMFAKAGFELSEYTGANGNWEPEKITTTAPLDRSERIDRRSSALQNTTNQITTGDQRSVFKFPWGGFGLLIFAFLIVVLWRKVKSQRGLK